MNKSVKGIRVKFWQVIISKTALIVTTNANASLIDRGNGLIYDTDLDITWLQDANYAQTSGYDVDGKLFWDEATSWTSELEYAGYTDWRLPSAGSQNGRNTHLFGSELGHLYYVDNIGATNGGPFVNFLSGQYIDFSNDWYWTDTQVIRPNTSAFRFADGFQDIRYENSLYSAWAVHDGDIGASVVPVPAAVWLFGSGLIGLIGLAKRKDHKS